MKNNKVPPAFQPEPQQPPDPPRKADVHGPTRISYRRNLPHQVPPGFPIFLTWNLKGSLPKHAIQTLEEERLRLQKDPKRNNETARERNVRHGKIQFARSDRLLDKLANESRQESQSISPMWLKDCNVSRVVVESFLWGVPDRYLLYGFVVMANHIHILLTPRVDLSTITQGIKGWTGRQINKLLNRTGTQFWQNESYDHWARDEEEMVRIISYIERNPVTAGLCESPELWPWSSARWRSEFGWKMGEPFQPQWSERIIGQLSKGG